jgi:DNA-binding SARP family transcriptional activator/WD40 repeat protein/energy-coupling factor transporter ATP-binding protein EcfA2
VLDFHILGPLEVVANGRPLELGGPRQRALLAILLVHRLEVVSSDLLIDRLWDENPPATALKTLQAYISHLRKALGPGVIVTERRGYRLAVEPEQVDAGRFEALSAEGRRALAGGDAGRARERLRAALGLWRGEPLADFAYEPFAQGAIALLREARLTALEDRIDADLALGRDGELVGELESLVAANPLQERLRGQLMLSLYRSGRQADALSVYRQASELLREELGLEPSRTLQTLERSILEQDASLDDDGRRVAVAAHGSSPGACPFKGLAFFDRGDAEYFFGRERLVSDLSARLAESTLVGILGPSGIGKSSLLRAGVLPALSAGVLPGSSGWRQVLVRPGEAPCAELRRVLGGTSLDETLERLRSRERIVLAIDQFEELFTLCDSEEQRVGFLEELAAAARHPEQRALIVVALRADFYGRMASYPSFGELLSASHALVGPMDHDELARAIEQPAARAGLELDHGLAVALVSEVAGKPGGLPLLSTTLLELWRDRRGRALRYESYRASGGVRGAVARLAEHAYTQLGEDERRVARGLMLRLAGGDAQALAPRRVLIADLERLDGVEPVLRALTDARLLTVSDGEVELSHEALLREWPRYTSWLEEDRTGRRLHAHLVATTREWDATGRDPADLYRGARLAGALEWAGQRGDELGALERRFLDASRRRAERNARRLRGALAGVALLLLASLVAGAIALVQKRDANAEARVALARQLGAQAINEPRLDVAMLLAREAVNLDRSPQTQGSLLATLERAPAVVGTLALPINGPPQQLAVSPDGGTLAVGAIDLSRLVPMGSGQHVGVLRLYDARTHRVTGPALTDFAGALAPVYSSDGRLLAYPTAGVAPSIAVRDARTLRLVHTLALDPLQLSAFIPDLAHARILISPDGHSVYCAYQDFSQDYYPRATVLARWSLPSGRLVSTTRIDGSAVLAVSPTDAGSRITVVDPRSVAVFDARSLRRLAWTAITPAPAAPSAAAISPDGQTIAIASHTGIVTFVDAISGDARRAAGPNSGSVASLAYSQDGRSVATAANDTVIVWDPRSATPREVLSVPGGQVLGTTFSAGGQTLYTSSVEGLVLEWDLTGERTFGRRFELGSAPSCCGVLTPLALSPDGATFAVRLGGSAVGLFSARTLQRLAAFSVSPAGAVVTALGWSPVAPELAVGGSSGLVQLWRTDGTPRLARTLRGLQPALGLPEAVEAVAFSPDGELVSASDSSQTVGGVASFFSGNPQTFTSDHPNDRLSSLAVWRTGTGALTAAPLDLGTGSSPVDPLAFSPHGRVVAVGAPDGRALIVDPTTARMRRTLQPIGGDFTGSLAFAPDGTLATGTLSGIVQLWNPATGAQVAGPLPVAAGPVSSITFDASGRRFVTTAGADGAVKIFRAATLQQEGAALQTGQRAASAAAFTLHGSSLLVVDAAGRGVTWPMSLAAWEQRACTVAGRKLTRQEWARYLPGQRYAPVCP